MACNQKTLLLMSRFANGEATADEASRAAAHVESCVNCRELIDEWQGQRQLLVWASTLELPELSPDKLREIAQREEPMSVPQRPSRRIAWPRIRINWAHSSATMATVITFGLVTMYASRNALFTPRLPDGTTLGSAAPTVRVRNGVVLELAPNTRVTRLGDDKVRLDAGWIRATVRHGSSLRIQTKRLDVRDVGTVFQMNASPSSDSVTVEEGDVSVSCGGKTYPVHRQQNLFASDKGAPVLGAFPAYEPEEDAPGQPLVNSKDVFVPTDKQGLDWSEGRQRLAAAFPDARSNGSSGSSLAWPHEDSVFRFSRSIAQGARKGMRAHFAEIARAQSGATANIGAWEFPVTYVMVDNVVDPKGLRPDTYQVAMAANGSGLFWRFKGSEGTVVDAPVSFERHPKIRTGGSGYSSTGNIEEVFSYEDGKRPTAYFRFLDWPGTLKPTLRLELKPLDGYGGEARAMQGELIRRIAGVPGFTQAEGRASMLYLDPGRSRKMMFVWNADAGRQVNRILDESARARGGSALMGALMTDEPLLQPRLPAGAYLLRWTLPSQGGTPYWEVVTLRGRAAVVLPIRDDKAEGWNSGSLNSRQSGLVTGYGATRPLEAEIGTGSARDGGFPFQFVITDGSKKPRKLGDGWIHVRTPRAGEEGVKN